MKQILSYIWKSLLIIATCVALIFFFINIEARAYVKTPEKLPKEVQTAIVLGASILSNGDLSLILKDRVDTTIDLYKDGKITTILVTGDDGTLGYNEVIPMKNYLLEKGIPEHAIFLDHAGFDTYSSMYRARDIFKVGDVVIVTQSFHLPRALFIARMLGVNAYGVSADKHDYFLKNSLREILADVKAVYDIIRHRVPKYLGEEIPVTTT